MVYECEHCGYSTFKNSNFLRHKNRKYPCHKVINGNNLENNENNTTYQNVANIYQNVAKTYQNVAKTYQNVANEFKCTKCCKILSSKQNLLRHTNVCKGVDNFTCEVCFKRFPSRDMKYKHKSNGKCVPFDPQNVTINNTTNNNNITTNNTSNNTTNNNITNNNNITQIVNVFGNEDLSYLSNDRSILEKLRMFGKSGIYGLSKIIDDVHFNKERPENNTLIKPEEFGNGVLILNDDKKWEFREFEDIRGTLINTIIKYIKAYNVVKTNLGVRLVEPKERNIIKHLIYEFMALDGLIPRDLFEELNMDEDNIEIDDTEVKSKLRKFDKSTMKNIHNKTIIDYKRDNGDYIKK